MRHRNKKNILGREKASREAMMRNLAESLILHESIETTLAKAKALRATVEPLITKAKNDNLNSRRQIKKILFTNQVQAKLIKEVAPRYKNRNGGYTRIIKLGYRQNDSAAMAKIELV